ncbi:FAD-binding domain-containing protein [Wolfiporia cocos MD-104 SS10]|uniref:FAD-binding domain-containing protein n=1 Tax=Wolfiporia cocos (strain MD-104) TaxID=742152 RepID=A0A2H3IYD0_WOLCO|nr:FAD-binding domain-containing protein [Wolfiporia cocos MD-104 SS10]
MATSAAEELREFCQTPGSASQFFPFGSQGYKDSVRHWLQSSSDVAEAAVQPGNAKDLSEIVKILGKWRAPFAVKGGGHATSPNLSSTRGIQIYMNRFENVRYLRKPDKRLEVGAGCLWDRVYREVVPLGRNVIGGAASEGVGVAGWCLGGGYSLKSNNYGIGIDSILGFEVVLPDGRIVNANQNENSDLFAALKGGGNNFGIVTKFILKTYPQRRTYGARITFQKPEFEQAEAAIADFAEKETKRRAAIVAAFRHTLIPGKTEPESVINLTCIYDGKKRTYDPFKRFQSIKGSPYQPDAAGWGVRAAAAPVQPMSFAQRAIKVSNVDDSDNDADDDGGSSEISASAAAAGFREMDYFEADQLSGSRFDPPEWQKQSSPALDMPTFAQVRTAQPMMMAAAAPMPTPQKSSMSGVGEVKGCGRFGCIMVSGYTKKLVKTVSEQSRISASKMANNGGRMVIIDVWPFLPRLFETSTPSAWPHPRGKVWFPCLAYFLWEEEKDTKFWLDEMARAFAKIKEVAKKEGCHEDSFPAYCNVSLDTTTPEEIYRDNLPWLMDLRAKYDPDDVMGLCSGFKIPHPGGRAKPDGDRDTVST